MSELTQFNKTKEIVQASRVDFEKLAKVVGGVNFEREKVFAIQALKESKWLCSAAYHNQDSLKMAVINVAATGLSLNPIRKQAYLIPRDKKVCLDISYLGMIQIALDCGAIKWAKAEIVYEKDTFTQTGINKVPQHDFSPFADRGKIVGAYCVAKTHDDEYLTTIMAIDDIYSIRNRSISWKSGKNCPWKTDEGEMIKKTVIRRAYKSWALTNTKNHGERLEKVIEVTNETHQVDLKNPPKEKEEASPEREEKIEKMRGKLEWLEKSEEKAVKFLNDTFQRKIEKIEDLTESELDHFDSLLDGWVEQNCKKKNTQAENDEEEESVAGMELQGGPDYEDAQFSQ